ncbi:MAG: hypothetical protein AB7N76_21460 [Planctomycetota bacterium]
MPAVVIGGEGYLGSRVVGALRAGGLECLTAGRSGRADLRLDLSHPETLAPLADAAAVVNLADAWGAPPDAAITASGGLFVETTAHPRACERLLSLAPDSAVLVGAGIFPGLSDLLAAEAARALAAPLARLRLGVRFSPLAGAGAGTCGLMAELLGEDSVTWDSGRRVDRPGLGPGPRLPFARGERATLLLPLCEPPLLARALGGEGRTITSSAALAPAPLTALARLGAFAPRGLRRAAWVRALTRLGLRLLRGVLLGWRATPVELVAVAESEGGETLRARLEATDGMLAAGQAIAAMTLELLAASPAPGIHVPAGALRLDPLLARMSGLGSRVIYEPPAPWSCGSAG